MSNGELVSIAIGTAIGSTIGIGVPLGLMWLRKRRWERDFRERVKRELPFPVELRNTGTDVGYWPPGHDPMERP